MTLPDPETVVSRARESITGDSESPTADSRVNLAVADPVDYDSVDLTDESYVGPDASALGRLAAAVAVEGDAAVHYPEPDFTVGGPWLVLAPLSGLVSTVATGTGRAAVTLDYDGSDDTALDGLDERVSELTEAARPSHDHYPVESDNRGVFTTGMTTFALDSLATDGNLTATFDVSTTPATGSDRVESRFADVEGVESVEYESVVGVERAAPSPELREAAETAHRRVLGDCEYEWLPEGGVFAEIPGAEKMALGTGTPGAAEFSHEQYETCVDLLESTLSNLGVRA